MKTLFVAVVFLPLVAGVALGQPQPLNDKQMDRVTAGYAAYTCDPTTGCDISLPAPSVSLPPAPQLPSRLLPGATLSENGIISLPVPYLFAAISPPIRN